MTDDRLKPQAGLDHISAYVPGRPIEDVQREFGLLEVIKLASNENPAAPTPKAVAAMEAALLGIPSLAFSMEVPGNKQFSHGQKNNRFDLPAMVAAEITHEVLLNGLPPGVSLLNVNFPWKTQVGTKVKMTSIEVRKYRDYVLQRKDPRGRPYYWVWGSRLPTYKKDSDVYAVHRDEIISISPLSLDLTPSVAGQTRSLGKHLESRIGAMYDTLSRINTNKDD